MIDMRTPLAAGLRFASCALRDGPSMEVNTPARAELSIPVPVFATRFRRACFYYLTPSPLSLSVSNTDRMLRAATTGGRSRWGARPDGQITGAVWRRPVQPLLQKYSCSRFDQITFISTLSCPGRGALAIVTNVGAGCDGRGGAFDEQR
jgi:hypothetical protein